MAPRGCSDDTYTQLAEQLVEQLAMPGGEPAEVLCPASEGRRGEGQASPAHKFTWEELSRLNERHNAHVAVRGKVRRHRQSEVN